VTDDRDRRYLKYIQDAIAPIQAHTRGGRGAFLHDVDVQDAVLRYLHRTITTTGSCEN
jgi:hypothetical protein